MSNKQDRLEKLGYSEGASFMNDTATDWQAVRLLELDEEDREFTPLTVFETISGLRVGDYSQADADQFWEQAIGLNAPYVKDPAFLFGFVEGAQKAADQMTFGLGPAAMQAAG